MTALFRRNEFGTVLIFTEGLCLSPSASLEHGFPAGRAEFIRRHIPGNKVTAAPKVIFACPLRFSVIVGYSEDFSAAFRAQVCIRLCADMIGADRFILLTGVIGIVVPGSTFKNPASALRAFSGHDNDDGLGIGTVWEIRASQE